MNYREKERAINNALWEWPVIQYRGGNSSNPIETLPDNIVEIYRSLQYTDKQILERWKEIQIIKKETDKIYGNHYQCRRKRWFQYKTRHRYYADRRKKYYLDYPPHERPLRLRIGWSEGYVDGLKKEYIASLTEKKEERKIVKHSSEFRKSKIHSINKTK